jgi:hypothetical protein
MLAVVVRQALDPVAEQADVASRVGGQRLVAAYVDEETERRFGLACRLMSQEPVATCVPRNATPTSDRGGPTAAAPAGGASGAIGGDDEALGAGGWAVSAGLKMTSSSFILSNWSRGSWLKSPS